MDRTTGTLGRIRKLLARAERAGTPAEAQACTDKAVELMNQKREMLAKCPASHALELAIWSDKSRVDEEEKRKLAPLWGKYFDTTAG